MRTSSNVMGIQAKLMLERIAATLDAVQAGHQQKPAYLLADRPIHMDKPEPDEGERELEVVFAARDVVYLDERLTREIPSPIGQKRRRPDASYRTERVSPESGRTTDTAVQRGVRLQEDKRHRRNSTRKQRPGGRCRSLEKCSYRHMQGTWETHRRTSDRHPPHLRLSR